MAKKMLSKEERAKPVEVPILDDPILNDDIPPVMEPVDMVKNNNVVDNSHMYPNQPGYERFVSESNPTGKY